MNNPGDASAPDAPDSTSDSTEPTAPPEPTESTQASESETDWEAEAARYKSYARQWENRAKSNKAAADKFDALQSEHARAVAELAEYKSKAVAAEKAAQIADWKKQVSAATHVPADLLRGESLEDLQAHGELIAQAWKSAPRGPVVPQAGDQPDSSPDAARQFLQALFGGS